MGEVIVTMNSKQVQGITTTPEVIRKFLAPTLGLKIF
jgi:hypothetical protein